MRKIAFFGIFMASMLLMLQVAEAQTSPKYAYVNSGAILEKLPEMEQMKSDLQGYQTILQKKGQQMYQEFQTKQTDAAAKKERGELSPSRNKRSWANSRPCRTASSPMIRICRQN